ncbi:CPBP family intramembrane glutamic endopeptidase [Anaerosporobacter faecicola]|uniref:CPBP family intramembrane glutamic endopeptidase n=1 Tax=Anaerosporobacter faecicola TaxID=2718714 RepID=UPI00143C58F7|nr:type II CAAX endopeptidase family protein [Anaerosporobacter faecicola]
MKKWANTHTILFGVIVVILCMPVIWGITFPILKPLEKGYNWTIKYGLSALCALGIAYGAFQGKLFSLHAKGFWKGLISFGLLGVLGAIGAFFFSGGEVDLSPSIPTFLSYITMNFAIAISEELIFRGIILNHMLHALKNRKGLVWQAVIACSVVFGLRHLLNLITKPDAVIMTMTQVIFTFMAGCYLCAVYLRTKNLWVCIMIHFLEDFSTSIWEIYSSEVANAVGKDINMVSALGMVAIQIPYVIFAILMLKDKR